MLNKGRHGDVVGMVLYFAAIFLTIKTLDYIKNKSNTTQQTMELKHEVHTKAVD